MCKNYIVHREFTRKQLVISAELLPLYIEMLRVQHQHSHKYSKIIQNMRRIMVVSLYKLTNHQ